MTNSISNLNNPNVSLLNKEQLNDLIKSIEEGISYFLHVSKDLSKAKKAQKLNARLINLYYKKFIK